MPEAHASNTDDGDIEAAAAAERTDAEFVTRAPRRRVALDQLVEGPATAAMIGNDRAIDTSTANTALDELLGRSMVEVLIEEQGIYGITPTGEQAIYRIQANRSV